MTEKMSDAYEQYFEQANKATQMQQSLSLISGGMNVLNTFANRSNVDRAHSQMDTQMANSEAALFNNFTKAIGDFKVITAAKNVDVRSQSVDSQIVGSGMAMGEDISLQKRALEFQKQVNESNQRISEYQSLFNFASSAALML